MIRLEGVGRAYGDAKSRTDALDGIDLTIARGDHLAILGPSGSGKSTLLNIMGCLDRPTSGRCIFMGDDTSQLSDARLSEIRNRSVGFVFQLFNLVPELTARENVELPLVYAGAGAERRRMALAALSRVGLDARAEHRAAVLSGGEQQRVAVARALVNRPDVILADEPTGSIDAASATVILDLLAWLNAQGCAVVVVTHNRAVAASAARRILLRSGTIEAVAEGPGESVHQARPTLRRPPAMAVRALPR